MPGDRRHAHFLPYFDGLRGFGALVVFLNHMGMSHLLPLGAPTAIGFFTNGIFAVDVFFALSGYVMSMLASRSHESLPAISIRRYIRLALPAAASCLLSVTLLAAGFYFNRSLAALNGSLWLGGWFDFEPSFWGALREGAVGIFAAPGSAYNSSLWTLYYELWYSLAIFVGALLGRWWWLSLLVGSAVTYYSGGGDLGAPTSFAAGALAFHFHAMLDNRSASAAYGSVARRTLRMSAALMILFAFYLATYPRFPAVGAETLYAWFSIPVVDVAAPAAAAAIIVATIRWSPLFSRLFSVRPMLLLGKLSFSIYLVHLPIICSVGSWLGIALYPSISSSSRVMAKIEIALIFGVVAGTVFLSAAMFSRFFDTPSTTLGRLLSDMLDRHLMRPRKDAMPRRLAPNSHPPHRRDGI